MISRFLRGKTRLLLFALALILIVSLVFWIISYRNRSVILDLALYSGNSWGVPQNFTYLIYDKAVEMFEQRYAEEGYHVVLRTGTMYKDYSEWFAQLVLKGKEPDLFLIVEEDFSTYASIGLLENLDSYIERTALSSDQFFENALRAGQYNASQYSLPIGVVPSFLIVNNTLLDSLGVELDLDNWTWDQFYEVCDEITEDLDGDAIPDRFGVEGYDWHQAFYTNDESLFTEDNSAADFDPLRAEQMLEFLKRLQALNKGELVKEGTFEKGNVGFKTFNFSEFRVYGSYPYRILRYEDFNWEAIPFPAGPSGSSKSKLYTVQMGMSSRSSHKDVAFEFLSFVSSDEEFQNQVWEYTNMLPVNRTVFDEIYTSGVMQRDGMRPLDRDFIETVIAESYIDPVFKKYPTIDEYITQWILAFLSQDQNTKKAVDDLRQLIHERLTDEYAVRTVSY